MNGMVPVNIRIPGVGTVTYGLHWVPRIGEALMSGGVTYRVADVLHEVSVAKITLVLRVEVPR